MKLRINELDDTITVPLIGGEVILREPSMVELSEIAALIQEADAAILAQREDPTEQARLVYTYNESPHGQAFLKIIKMLSGEDIGPDRAYGWAMTPGACGAIHAHFRSPLPGEA